MKLDKELTHIGFFDIEECKQAIEICNTIYPHLKTGFRERKINDDVKHPDSSASGSIHPSYKYFELQWWKKIKALYGEDAWYDAKKYCYTIQIKGKANKNQSFDFYPRKNKLFIFHKRKWVDGGLGWMIDNLVQKALNDT